MAHEQWDKWHIQKSTVRFPNIHAMSPANRASILKIETLPSSESKNTVSNLSLVIAISCRFFDKTRFEQNIYPCRSIKPEHKSGFLHRSNALPEVYNIYLHYIWWSQARMSLAPGCSFICVSIWTQVKTCFAKVNEVVSAIQVHSSAEYLP